MWNQDITEAGYVLTSDGLTTDLYTDYSGPAKMRRANAAAQQGQSVTWKRLVSETMLRQHL